jgi:hypothetical protein
VYHIDNVLGFSEAETYEVLQLFAVSFIAVIIGSTAYYRP